MAGMDPLEDPLERLLAERACERLIIDFVHRLDLGEPGSVAELFTEDGTWEWPLPEGTDGGPWAGTRCARTSTPAPWTASRAG